MQALSQSFHRMKIPSNCYVFAVILAVTVFIGCHNNPITAPPPGKDWVIFNPSNSPMKTKNINCVFISNEEDTWLGTDSGAYKFSKGSWSSYRDSLGYQVFENGVGTVTVAVVKSIGEGKDGSMWFGMNGGGLVRYDPFSSVGVYQKYSASDVGDELINGVSGQEVQLGDVWVGTFYGAAYYTPNSTVLGAGTWTQITNSQNQDIPPAPSISALEVNIIDSKTWFGTYSQGLVSFDYTSQSWVTYASPGAISDPQVNGLAFDLAGNVWVAMNLGIGELYPGHSTWVNVYPSVSGGNSPLTGTSTVTSVTTDKNSLRYFGTSNVGVLRLNDTTWTSFDTSNCPIPSNHINGVQLDQRGNLWIGTDNGLAAYNPTGTVFQ
jgi:ligand-binding sensor domain-containing protein